MATSVLLEALRALLTPDLLSRVSSLLGESEASIQKGLGAAFPTLLAALLRRADDPGARDGLYSLIDDSANSTSSVLAQAGSLLSPSGSSPAGALGNQLLGTLFGNRTSGLASALGSFAGMKPSSASSLLSLAAPLVMSVLRDRSRSEGATGGSLFAWLAGQRGAIQDAVPPALASVLGGEPPRRVVPPPLRHEERSQGRPWLWPLLGLLVLGGLWMLFRSPEEPRVAERSPAVSAAPPAARDLVSARLPDGAELRIPANGLEDRLLSMLKDPSRPLDWLDFDRLLFETDSAKLKPESRAQLQDIAAILRAYPGARVRVGGYTDNQGDPAYNLKLSADRAQSVARELAALGVDPSRVEAEGYGEEHPVASNDTDQGRARNRRTALLVVSR